MNLVWEYGPADPVEQSVLLSIAGHCTEGQTRCFPSYARLAHRIRRSERTVIRSVYSLASQGYIEIISKGNGKGNKTEFQILPKALKGRHPVILSDDSFDGERVTGDALKGDSDDIKGDSLSSKGDSDDNPPHPLYGVTSINKQEQEEQSLPSPSASGDGLLFEVAPESTFPKPKIKSASKAEDPRFAEFRALFEKYFVHCNKVSPEWSAKEATRLRDWLRGNPTITPEQWKQILRHRARSPGVNNALPLSQWVGKALSWLNTLANNHGTPLSENQNAQGFKSKQQRTEDSFAEVARKLTGNPAGVAPTHLGAPRRDEPGGDRVFPERVIEGAH